jgi:hypothetical protein
MMPAKTIPVFFKVSKGRVHLNAGWMWLVNKWEYGDLIEDVAQFESREDAERAAEQFNRLNP